MDAGTLAKRLSSLPGDIPVLFYATRALAEESYCRGSGVTAEHFWDGEQGWQPCVTIELGKEL